MRSPEAVRDYDAQVLDYKRVRDELAGYIDVLKQTVSGADLTVYEVLSKSIATADRLSGLPSEVLELCDIPKSFLSTSGLKRLVDLIQATERAHTIARASSDAWKATQLLYPDRFTVEAACDLARRTADIFRKLAQARASLPAYGLNEACAVEELEAVRTHLQARDELPAWLQPLLTKLLETDAAKRLLSFLASCENCSKQAASLERDALTEVSADNLARIQAAQAICKSAGLDNLNSDKLDKVLEEGRGRIAQWRALEAALRPLVVARASAEGWGLSDIGLAQRVVEVTGRPALLCRNSVLTEPAAVVSLKRLCAQLRWLQTQKANLTRRVSMSVPATPEALSEHAATLRSAGTFRLFSASYHRANRLARSLSLDAKLDRQAAARLFDELATFRRNERTFLNDTQGPLLFGPQFRGIDTDAEPFARLVPFFEYVNSTFGTIENRDLRNFLRTADIDEIALLPAVGSGTAMCKDYRSLQSALKSDEETILKLERARSALAPNLSAFRNPNDTHVDALPSLAKETRDNLALRKTLDADEYCATVLGSQFRGWQTQDEDLLKAAEWAKAALPIASALRAAIDAGKISEALAAVSRVLELDDQVQRQLAELELTAKIPVAHFTGTGRAGPTADALEKAGADAEGLLNHAAMATIMAEVEQTGLMRLLKHRLESVGNLCDLSSQAEALVIRALAKQVYSIHRQSLARYTGGKLDDLRSSLASKDRDIISLCRKHVRHKVFSASRPPRGNGMGRKSTWTQMALIENEIGKQQRFISVRDLTERAGKALVELKPCWMMSPLAVAQYVKKGALKFDLCIIDEASQMPPEAAIGALLRSKQVAIVGDTNQLPPSSFFKKMVEDEEADEDETVLDESILEMANSTFRPPRRLRWHYRSRHSGLIKFSNRLIYEDNLIVFPSANKSLSRMGVEHRHVAGLYKSGTNAIEARALVDATLEFMRRDPDRSLGVVTLNQKQRDLISEEFEQALTRDLAAQTYVETWKSRNDGLEEFFIRKS